MPCWRANGRPGACTVYTMMYTDTLSRSIRFEKNKKKKKKTEREHIKIGRVIFEIKNPRRVQLIIYQPFPFQWNPFCSGCLWSPKIYTRICIYTYPVYIKYNARAKSFFFFFQTRTRRRGLDATRRCKTEIRLKLLKVEYIILSRIQDYFVYGRSSYANIIIVV